MSDYREYLANTCQTENYIKRYCEKCHSLVKLHGAANLRLPVFHHCPKCNKKQVPKLMLFGFIKRHKSSLHRRWYFDQRTRRNLFPGSVISYLLCMSWG